MEPDYPDFEVAEQRFRDFLSHEGVSVSDVRYITPSDVALVGDRVFVRPPGPSSRDAARVVYDAAVVRARGVVLAAFCALEKSVCAYVYGPTDDEEAEQLMIGNGLKCAIPVPLRVATHMRGLRWWLAKFGESIFGIDNARKQERFK